ncbi:uncharacterized protein LOC114321337 isoform X1 [Camellia sinensis]|uniref:uncharacterized protein LOC114321337 isoform X1 n=1 Tax=Camellia sinensis TaxID=4442 RepID=UPI001035F351|nr:uncharacterized protein LOC114321337 isoform X1 [Camellia sinensis]
MSAQKKRNFQIEAFKHRVVVDPKYAEKTGKILEHAIQEIYNHNASGLSFEELYRNAYNMVLHKFGENLYSRLVSTMTSHLKEIARSIETWFSFDPTANLGLDVASCIITRAPLGQDAEGKTKYVIRPYIDQFSRCLYVEYKKNGIDVQCQVDWLNKFMAAMWPYLDKMASLCGLVDNSYGCMEKNFHFRIELI